MTNWIQDGKFQIWTEVERFHKDHFGGKYLCSLVFYNPKTKEKIEGDLEIINCGYDISTSFQYGNEINEYWSMPLSCTCMKTDSRFQAKIWEKVREYIDWKETKFK